MTTIGIDLGWRHCRVVVFNELSELISVTDSSRDFLTTDAPTETLPIIAWRKQRNGTSEEEYDQHSVLVGNDALFGLLYPKTWEVEHAFQNLAKGSRVDALDKKLKINPLGALLEKLQRDIDAAGYLSPGATIRITADEEVLRSSSLKAALPETWQNARAVSRADAARTYYDDFMRCRKSSDALVVDLGFKTLLVTRYEEGATDTGASYPSSSLTYGENSAADNDGKGFPNRGDSFIDAAFGTWRKFIAAEMSYAARGKFRSLNARETYRHIEEWWRQSLRADRRNNNKSTPPHEVPFMFPVEVNPEKQPFVGLDPHIVFKSIASEIKKAFTNGIPACPAGDNAFGEGAELILIGQYSDIPEIADPLVPAIRMLFIRDSVSKNKSANRLPASGLAAGAAMAPDDVCSSLASTPLNLGGSRR